MNLQLPVQSLPITAYVVSLNFEPHSWRGVFDKALCDKVCQCLATGLWISQGTPMSATKVVTEIFLKVVLNTTLQRTNDGSNVCVCSA